MARPIKQGLDYFPIDVNFFSNKKVKNLRRAHGSIGVLTYINLLCRVYENGYYYRFDDLEELSMDIAEEIAAGQLRSTATSVTETINYLVGRGILDEGLFERGIISGVALQEQYALAAKNAKRKPKMDVHLLVDVDLVVRSNEVSTEETPVNSEETPVNSEFSTQSKVNKNKLNNTITTTTTGARTRVEPTIVEVARYFEEECEMESKTMALSEAKLFIAYNANRKWDCLPNWERAADLWAERMGDR